MQHFTAADAALRDGDLATYQSELQQAQALVEQANQLAERRFAHPFPVALRDPLALEAEPRCPGELGGVHLGLLEVPE